MPSFALAKMSSKAVSSDPFSMKVPATIATPSRIANAVRAARSFRAASPRSASASISSPGRARQPRSRISSMTSSSPSQRRSAATCPSASTITRSAYAATFGSWVTTTTVCPKLVDRLPQQVEHARSRLRVEVAGRLVGEDDGWARDQRPRDRDPLLLAAGELGGPVGRPVGRGRRSSSSGRASPDRRRAPAIRSGSSTFSAASRTGTRLKNWKMKPSFSRRSAVIPLSSRAVTSTPSTQALPAGRLVEPGEQVHQRRLARAGGADDRGQLPGGEVERDVAQRVDGRLALAVAAAESLAGDDRLPDFRCRRCFHRRRG